jgi:hypothetical protein
MSNAFMETPRSTLPYSLSRIILCLSGVASLAGIGWPALYRDTETIRKAWIANDWVTLLLVLPLLFVVLRFSRRGSARGQLVWMGLLGYMVYNYAFYLFGTAFNRFFLLYVALFSLSIAALIIGLSGLPAQQISRRFSRQTPVRWISLYLLFISVPLGLFELSQCLRFIVSGQLPAAPTLIFALDLSVVVPGTALAAVLLWQRKTWGYVLATMMLVKAFTYGMVLSFATALIAGFRWDGRWDPLMPFYLFIALGGFLCGLVLLKNLRAANTQGDTKEIPASASDLHYS